MAALTALARRIIPASVITRPERLETLTDQEVAQLYSRFGDRERVLLALTAEMDRRDREDRQRERLAQLQARRRALREEYQLYLEAAYVAAETATRGHMLNRAGRAAGVDPRSLFSGRADRARKYASEELANWWQANGRLTFTEYVRQSREQRPAA